jgi:CheY-like chemotaxis protein
MSDTSLEKILIIDDNADYRKLIKTFISKLLPTVETIEFDPVFEGVPGDDFNWSEIDVLLLDYHLSIVGTTGLDIMHKHHKKPSFPATIMLTGAGTEEVAVRALKTGIFEYQPKQSLTKDKLKQSIIHAWEDKKSQRKKRQEITQHNKSFSKEVFYENLENTLAKKEIERALVVINPDNIHKLEQQIGIIGRDNLINHIGKNSFDVFKLGACNPNITKISDTAIAVQIDYPVNQETLEFNMQGLCKHLAKCTFKFSDEKYPFTVSIGLIKLGVFNTTAEQLILMATAASKRANAIEGNSYYIWKETNSLADFIEPDEVSNEQAAIDVSKIKISEEKEKLQIELKAAEEARERAETAIQTEQEAKNKLETELKIAAEAKEKAESALKAATEAKEKAEAEARARAEQEVREKAEAETKAQAEKEAREKAEAEAKARAEQEAREKAEAEAKVRAEQEAREKAEAETRAQAEKEAREKAEAETRAQAEKEAREKAEAETRAQAEKEAREKAEAALKTAIEAKEKLEAEAKARAEKETREKAEAETRAQAEKEAREKAEAETRAQAEKEAREKAEAELKAATEAKEKLEVEAKARMEQEANEKAEAEAKAQAEQEANEKAEAEAKAQEEQEANEKAEAEAKAQAEQEANEKTEAEAKAQAEQEANEKAEAEAKAQEEQEANEKAEAEAKEIEKGKLEAEIKAIAETKEKAEAEMKAAKEAEEKLEAKLKAIAETIPESAVPASSNSEQTSNEPELIDKAPTPTDSDQAAEQLQTNDEKLEIEKAVTEAAGSSIHDIEMQIRKLIEEKRIIQTYQPVMAMFDDGGDSDIELYKTGLKAIIEEDNEINEKLSDISVFSVSLQQLINEWILRQIFLRITETSKATCQNHFLVNVTEAWFSDITLFNWLQKILSQTKKYAPGKSIILDIPVDIFNKHKKRAKPLIDTLHKSHNFRVALSNIKTFDTISPDGQLASSKMLMIDIDKLHQLTEMLGPGNEEEEKKNDNNEEDNQRQNLLQHLKSTGIQIITSGIEDATLLTDAITGGTDYAIGSFIGEVQNSLVESGTVESFDLT